MEFTEWNDEFFKYVLLDEPEGWEVVQRVEEGGKHDMTNVVIVFRSPDGRFFSGYYTYTYNDGIIMQEAGYECKAVEKVVIDYVMK